MTRAAADPSICRCRVCQIARLGLDYTTHAADHSNPSSRPRVSPNTPPARVIPLCSKCLCEIGRGKTHVCDKKQKRDNLSNIVKNTSEKTKSKVTCNSLKSVAEDQGISTRGGTVQLVTGSNPLPVVIGAPKQRLKEKKFSHENLLKLQAANNLSDKSIK